MPVQILGGLPQNERVRMLDVRGVMPPSKLYGIKKPFKFVTSVPVLRVLAFRELKINTITPKRDLDLNILSQQLPKVIHEVLQTYENEGRHFADRLRSREDSEHVKAPEIEVIKDDGKQILRANIYFHFLLEHFCDTRYLDDSEIGEICVKVGAKLDELIWDEAEISVSVSTDATLNPYDDVGPQISPKVIQVITVGVEIVGRVHPFPSTTTLTIF